MSSRTVGNSKIQEAMAESTAHPDYDNLPESIKLIHSVSGYAWLGDERLMIIERETMPDMDVTE